MAGSVVGSETPLSQTPSSVTKPPAVSTTKGVVISSVKKALQFDDSPPRGSSETVLKLAPQAENEKAGLLVVRDANTTLACQSLPDVDSEKKLLVVGAENPALASQSVTDVDSEKLLLPVVDDPALPSTPSVVSTLEKTTTSKYFSFLVPYACFNVVLHQR
ncbi:hypothetical protein ACQ4PT_022382 [Festuca glaucescens]